MKSERGQNSDRRTVALLDVDNTLIDHDESYNDILIYSLLIEGILDVYLFTDMTLKMHNIQQREDLIIHLQNKGFTVHGVLTPNDLAWNYSDKVLNDFYYDFGISHIKLDKPSQALTNLIGKHFPDAILPENKAKLMTALPGRAYADAKNSLHRISEISSKSMSCKAVHDAITCCMGISMAYDKVLMFSHFAEHLPSWVSDIVVVDDKKQCRDGALKANEKFGFFVSVIDPEINKASVGKITGFA